MFNQSHSPLQPQHAWMASPVDGRRWEFFAQSDAPATLVLLPGVDPICLRTAKMARMEATLLVSNGPQSARRLMKLATLADVSEARRLIDRLNLSYDRDGSAFRIERVASGYRLLTQPLFAFWLGKIHHRQAELKLSPPALETLAIVAYRQPLTRSEIESVRRVQCSDMLKHLMDRNLIRIAGEDDSLGRPFLYETTRQFLELFGLMDLDRLPHADVLRKPRAASLAEAESRDDEMDASTAAA